MPQEGCLEEVFYLGIVFLAVTGERPHGSHGSLPSSTGVQEHVLSASYIVSRVGENSSLQLCPQSGFRHFVPNHSPHKEYTIYVFMYSMYSCPLYL